MKHRRKLLAGAVGAILAVAAAPFAQRAWEDRRIARDGEQRALWIELKEAELDCLERLQAKGLPPTAKIDAEIEACRRLAIDPTTGKTVEAPG
jgi:hypothetical protein